VLPYVDCFLYDIKCYSEEKHERMIGRSNREIIENLYSLSKEGKDIYVRVPVIPDFNDTPEELEKIAGLISSLENVKEVTLIPYHTLGKSKYETLGLSPRYETDRRITESELSKFRKIFENLGIDVN
jgi:pyruvate formate lyase activating enzyme